MNFHIEEKIEVPSDSPSHSYILPTYNVEEGKGIVESGALQINFVRGSKTENENIIPKQKGIITEHLIEVMIKHLQSVNVGDLRTRDTSIAITHLEDALLRLNKRSIERKNNNTQGTYKK